MTSKTEIKGLLNQVKQAAEKLKDKIFDLDEKIEALYSRRAFILNLPLSKEDYMNTIRANIKARTGVFQVHLKHELDTRFKLDFPTMQRTESNPVSIPLLDAGLTGYPLELSDRGFFYYFEDAIVNGVERALAGKVWPVDAVPAADRKIELAAIDEQVAKLTAERDALADDLVACGVTE